MTDHVLDMIDDTISALNQMPNLTLNGKYLTSYKLVEALTTATREVKLTITVEGGVVQSVQSNVPAHLSAVLIDLDDDSDEPIISEKIIIEELPNDE